MKRLIYLICVFTIAACGNGDNKADVNSQPVVSDSPTVAEMNTDTTSVIGANHIGEGQMRTDTPMKGANVGK